MSGGLRFLALLALLVGAVALSACGDEESSREAKNDYVRKLNAVQAAYASTLTAISQDLKPESSPRQARRTLKRFQDAIETQTRRLRDIEPPGAVQAEHAQIVDATAGFGAAVRDANLLLRDPTLRNIERWQNAIATAAQTLNSRIDSATRAINSKLRAS